MTSQDRLILLPGEPGFSEILSTPPPEPTHHRYVVRAGQGGHGLMESVSGEELTEYLEGGEYTERMDEIEGESDIPINSDCHSDILLLPTSVTIG